MRRSTYAKTKTRVKQFTARRRSSTRQVRLQGPLDRPAASRPTFREYAICVFDFKPFDKTRLLKNVCSRTSNILYRRRDPSRSRRTFWSAVPGDVRTPSVRGIRDENPRSDGRRGLLKIKTDFKKKYPRTRRRRRRPADRCRADAARLSSD